MSVFIEKLSLNYRQYRLLSGALFQFVRLAEEGRKRRGWGKV